MVPGSSREHLLYSTVRIETSSGQGTGFYFRFAVEGDKHFPLVITNRHVVEGADVAILRFHERSANSEDPSGLSFTVEASLRNNIVHHPGDLDLCAIHVGSIIKSIVGTGKQWFCVPLGLEDLPTDEFMGDLDAVEEILMIGYPNDIWDSHNNLPIIRRGITATHPAVDYEGCAVALADIACFPGSSGSPILIAQHTWYSKKQKTKMSGFRSCLLGILYAGPVVANGVLKPAPLPTSYSDDLYVQAMMHLGFYVKSRAIRDLEAPLRSRFLPSSVAQP